MCGICGFLNYKNKNRKNILQEMTDIMTHRGPDDSGIRLLEDGLVGLGHRRLSIIDLSQKQDSR